MDIQRVSDKSFRLKSKNTSFIINPEKNTDEDVIILTYKLDSLADFGQKLVIDGPGDYETAGVSIKSEKFDDGVAYEFFEEGQRLILLSTPKIAKEKEIQDASAVVVLLTDKAEGLSEIACDVLAVVGSEDNLPADRTNIKKADKINLKKTEEYKGFIIHLSK